MPYIDMTIAMMARAGASVTRDGGRIHALPGYGKASTITIEPDWSAAAFLLAAAKITGRDIPIASGMGDAPADSLQGDSVIVDMLAAIDQSERNDIDLTDAPDLIAPLAAACLFAKKPTRIRGAAHTRVKECDRVAVLCRELAKTGATLTAHDDGMDIIPTPAMSSAAISMDPEDDHRMAMTFGIVSLRLPHIEVQSPECVSKSFPSFWEVLDEIRRSIGKPE